VVRLRPFSTTSHACIIAWMRRASMKTQDVTNTVTYLPLKWTGTPKVNDPPSTRRLTYHNGDPVRETDYILYSILRLPRRDQIRTLKFYEMLDTIDTAALAGDDDSWQRAKSTLIAVYQEMLKCPDLIGEQVNELFQAYKERLVENRRRSKEVGLMGPGEQKAAPLAVQANAAIAEINEIQ
jgi:hypothetical protein